MVALLPRAAPGVRGTHPAPVGSTPLAPARTTPDFFVVLSGAPRSQAFVVNATTGAQGARISLPFPSADLDAAATSDGRTFVVAATEPGRCRTTLYRFRLSADGTPTPLAAFTTIPGIVQDRWAMAVSGNGQIVAYYALVCGLDIAPDGKTAYAATYRTTSDWQLRAFDLATGQSRLVPSFPGTPDSPAAVTVDPTGRYLLAQSYKETGPTRLARIDLATGRVTQLNATWAVDPAIAW